MNKRILIIAACAALPLIALSARSAASSAQDKKPAAPPAKAAPPAAGAATYEIDKTHSSIIFRIKHLGVSHFQGRFNDCKGKLVFDAAKPEASSVEVEVPVESIDTADEKRDTHVKSADFLNAKEFPTMTFKSKSVKKGDKGALKVEGELTLHGVTKPVTATAEPVGAADTKMGPRAGFDVQFDLKRSDFGMDKMLDMLGDEIHVSVGIEAVKK